MNEEKLLIPHYGENKKQCGKAREREKEKSLRRHSSSKKIASFRN
jgi:hypothetical protein